VLRDARFDAASAGPMAAAVIASSRAHPDLNDTAYAHGFHDGASTLKANWSSWRHGLPAKLDRLANQDRELSLVLPRTR
jgi:hypothetical protein